MKKLLILILIIAAILVGLYFYTDGEILQGRFSATELQSQSVVDSDIKIQSLIFNEKENEFTTIFGNTSSKTLTKTFNATLYLNEDEEPFAEQRLPALASLTGTEWTINAPDPGEYEVTVCVEDNCLTREFIVQE